MHFHRDQWRGDPFGGSGECNGKAHRAAPPTNDTGLRSRRRIERSRCAALRVPLGFQLGHVLFQQRDLFAGPFQHRALGVEFFAGD